MDRDLLTHLPIVVAVAKHRSFVAAAGSLNMSASAVSHAVRAVEDRIGEPLFTRTTRSVALTEAGKAFIERISAALEEIYAGVEDVRARRGDLMGTLKINASRVAFQIAVVPILARMAETHPHLKVEVHTNDALVDIVGQGFDAGIRLGESLEQDMVAVRLTPPFKAILVASNAYLEARGYPHTLADLAMHNCIGFRLLAAGNLYEWELVEEGRPVSVRTHGTTVITDATLARDLAWAGIGVAYIFEPLVREDLRLGTLRWILPHVSRQEDGLFLYYPRRASLSTRLRAFVNVARGFASAN